MSSCLFRRRTLSHSVNNKSGHFVLITVKNNPHRVFIYLLPPKNASFKGKIIHLHPRLLFSSSFPFYLVNQPSSSLSSSSPSFSSLLRASASASHQRQRPGSARRVKAGGGLSPTIYVCSFCACLYVYVWTWSLQTFMCLFFIISNNFAPHLPHYLAPLLPCLYLPGCCVQLWALIYFSVTRNYTPERAQLMSLSAIMAQRCSPLPRPTPPYSV